jgi:hypothetical protein
VSQKRSQANADTSLRHHRTPKGQRGQTMTKRLCLRGEKQLRHLRFLVFNLTEDRSYGICLPEALISDTLIKTILDRFHLLERIGDHVPLLEDNPLLDNYHQQVWAFLATLHAEINDIRAAQKAKAPPIAAKRPLHWCTWHQFKMWNWLMFKVIPTTQIRMKTMRYGCS